MSKGFVITLLVIGSLGLALPALAGGEQDTGSVIYYAETGPDGIIHCAGYNSLVATDGYVVGETQTYVAKDLYCVNADSYPANYFEARAQIYTSAEDICEDSNWQWNASGASDVAAIDPSIPESDCPSSEYYVLGQNDAAVNLEWQYWAEATNWVPS